MKYIKHHTEYFKITVAFYFKYWARIKCNKDFNQPKKIKFRGELWMQVLIKSIGRFCSAVILTILPNKGKMVKGGEHIQPTDKNELLYHLKKIISMFCLIAMLII